MKFFDTSIRVRHACPFCDLSAAFPEARMAIWCNRENEVLQIIVPDHSQLDEVLGAASEILGIREIVRSGKCALTMTRDCTCNRYRSVAAMADESGCWLFSPTIYYRGWETHRVLSPGRTKLQRFISELRRTGKVEIVSHKVREDLMMLLSISMIPVHFFEGLTDKQLHAIVIAYEQGLLEIPARAQMSRVARQEGISRSTYGEHLRKAIFRIIENSYPILKLYDTSTHRKDESESF